MEEKVKIDNLELLINYLDINEINNPVTNNKLNNVIIKTTVVGLDTQKKIDEILKKNIFILAIQSKNIEIKVKSKYNSWNYQGNILDNNTKIFYNIELQEIDKDLPENWNIEVAIANSSIMNWVRTRALSELLAEKGIITLKEYEEKIDFIKNRDGDNLINYISFGKAEKK